VSDGVSFDVHEVTALVGVFEKAGGGPTMAKVNAVVFKGAMNIKKDAASRIAGHPTLHRVPVSIDFDMYFSLKGPSAEIGPNLSRVQGNLAFIAENGSPTSAPFPFMRPAGEAEEPKFAQAIDDLAVEAIAP